MAIKGRCMCGDIRYRITRPPKVMGICHCKHCQRQSGSAFSTMAGIAPEDFQLQRGEPTVYRGGTTASGGSADIAFCGRCGSPIYTTLPGQAELLLKIGTLDDTTWFEPQFHVWCDHKQRWVTIEQDLASAGPP